MENQRAVLRSISFWLYLTAALCVMVTASVVFTLTHLYDIRKEQRDFAATAASLNKQIGAELPRMCAALGASGKQ